MHLGPLIAIVVTFAAWAAMVCSTLAVENTTVKYYADYQDKHLFPMLCFLVGLPLCWALSSKNARLAVLAVSTLLIVKYVI